MRFQSELLHKMCIDTVLDIKSICYSYKRQKNKQWSSKHYTDN